MERLTVFILFVIFNFAGIGLVSTAGPGHDQPAQAAPIKIDRRADRIEKQKADQPGLARQKVADRLVLS